MALLDGYTWTRLVGSVDSELARIEQSYPFVDTVSFGFVEPDIDRAGPELGVIVDVAPSRRLLSGDGVRELYPAIEPFRVEPSGDASEWSHSFPIVVRVIDRRLHALPTIAGRAPARLAAWTTLNLASGATNGWLLPRHATGGAGSVVTYSDTSTGTVIDDLGECVDAVIADTTKPPVGLNAVSVVRTPAIGMALSLVDSHGYKVGATLMSVDVNIGLIRYNKAPIRLTYNWAGSKVGDSGAGVFDRGGQIVAMHQGVADLYDSNGKRLLDPTGVPLNRAFGLCIYQVEAKKNASFEV